MPTDFTPHYRTIYQRTKYHFLRLVPEDIVQQTYYEAHRYYGNSRRHVEDPVALLWTIATRVALKAKRRVVYDPDAETRIRDPPSPTPEPWQLLSQREAAEHLAQAVAGLRPNYAAVLKAHYLDGRSCAELAEEYGVSRGVVKSRLCRGRKALRKALRRGVDE